MKKLLSMLLIAICVLINHQTKAQELDAYFHHAPFFAPKIGSYVETYIAIAGNSVYYKKNEDNVLQATLEITMLFKNVDDIKEFRKYKISSPPLSDTATVFPPFIDQQRIPIPDGVYNFELYIKDKNAPIETEPYVITDIVSVNFPENGISFSGIQPLESFIQNGSNNIFTKNDYECIPYVSDFYPPETKHLKFYAEVYNLAKTVGALEDVLFMFHIIETTTQKTVKELSSFQKVKAMNVNVLLKTIDIKTLPSGNYYLLIEARNRDNELIGSTKKFIQRLNNIEKKPVETDINKVNINFTFVEKYKSIDTLGFYLKSLLPIADRREQEYIDNQLDAQNLQYMQKFFYAFWQTRNMEEPEKAWKEYTAKLKVVDQLYATRFKPGFATERGRVYLRYGKPNTVIEERNEPQAYPYEMWHYYKIADQSNRRFVFYNEDLASKEYKLLHSNMEGEMSNPNWLSILYSNGSGSGTNTGERKAENYWKNQ